MTRPSTRRGWENRSRVSRACDRCKKRKVRCSGTQPCEECIRVALDCVYAAPYNRGRRPPPPLPTHALSPPSASASRAYSAVGRRDGSPAQERSITEPSGATPSSPPSSSPRDSRPAHSEPVAVVETEPPSRNSPEPSQVDLQGHYVGPASGVSVFLRVRNRLHRQYSNFTFGDAPLPDFDPSSCVMISKKESLMLVKHYFDFTVPVDRFLHRPTVMAWLEEFHETFGTMKQSQDAPAQRALLWTMFAMAQDTLSFEPDPAVTDKSMKYFILSERHLSKESGAVSLISVQARLCQCLWLLSQSRINHCWTLFGTAARLALAIGLHRHRRVDATDMLSPVEVECRRRTFWNAYCLDNYLSVALGRPRLFHDEDIDQELPSCMDDDDIKTHGIHRPVNKRQSLMFGSVAYSKLSRIISQVLHDLYSIRPPSIAERCRFTSQYSQSLKHWRADISRFLGDDNLDVGLLLPIFQRQRNMCNFAYWHTIVLIHRPFLLDSLTQSQQKQGSRSWYPPKPEVDYNIRECLNAAMSIVSTLDEIIQNGIMSRAFWLTTYVAFSAVVVLYIYVIQKDWSPTGSYKPYLDAATRCQAQLFTMTHEGSLVTRYCVVLEELRLEAIKQIAAPPAASSSQPVDRPAGADQIARELAPPAGVDNLATATSASLTDFAGVNGIFELDPGLEGTMEDIASWVQFESMVVPGMSGLGAF